MTAGASLERNPGDSMIVEIGHFALILALLVALVQSVLPLMGASRRHFGWMAVGRSTALAQFALIGLAMASLMHAYIVSDFSVLNVIQNSHTDKPMLYKVTGIWGNHEGSMLLWVFILSVCSTAVAVFSDNLPPELRARVLAVQGMISTGFLLFILLTSNPFQRVPVPPAMCRSRRRTSRTRGASADNPPRPTARTRARPLCAKRRTGRTACASMACAPPAPAGPRRSIAATGHGAAVAAACLVGASGGRASASHPVRLIRHSAVSGAIPVPAYASPTALALIWRKFRPPVR